MNITPKQPNIKIIETSGQPMVSSKQIAGDFNKRHANVLRDISELECTTEFLKLNFEFSTYRPEGAKRDYPYANMTRDGFAFLAMGFTGKEAARWKEKYITAFNAMEMQIKQPVTLDLNSPSQLRGLLANYAERTEVAEAEVLRLANANVELTDDANALACIAKADGSLCMRDAAKSLQIRPIDLTNFLSHNGWIYRQAQKGPWLGYQSKITSGLLEHKVTTVDRSDGTEKIVTQCRVTPKGLSKLAKLIPAAVQEVA